MSTVKQRGRTKREEERDGVVCQYVSFTKRADKQVKESARERERESREERGGQTE